MRGDAQAIPTMALRSARDGSTSLHEGSTLLEIVVQNRDRAPFNWVVRLDPRNGSVVVLHMEGGSALS